MSVSNLHMSFGGGYYHRLYCGDNTEAQSVRNLLCCHQTSALRLPLERLGAEEVQKVQKMQKER